MADWQVRHTAEIVARNAAKLASAKAMLAHGGIPSYHDYSDDNTTLAAGVASATGGKRANRKRRRKLREVSKRANRR